uniref:Uncharacterized protein n=1 Tax=Lactuca sativa TaxID=4236 RepID=A0A9R1X679_LACSA|nr:hypothetical protein LSAT_V11C600299940 [Lactuca sativa]
MVLEKYEIGEEYDEEPFVNNFQIVSQLVSKNDFTQELGKDSFKDKEELIRATKLYNIRTHKQFEFVQSNEKEVGILKLKEYISLHTCLNNNISQGHPNLDGNLIAQEIKHHIKD